MNLQYQLELKLKDFECRKLQQQMQVMQQMINEKCLRFNTIKHQLAETFSALIQNVQLELQNLKKELLDLIQTQKIEVQGILQNYNQSQYIYELQLLNQQYYEEKEQYKIRVEQLSQQLIESEKNEVYLMMLNTKYIKENEDLQTELLNRNKCLVSQTDTNFYPNKTGFQSKFLNKHT